MSAMKSVWAGLGAALLLASLCAPARGQERPVFELEVRRSATARLLIELSPLLLQSSVSESRAGSRELASRLVADLVYSGLFAFKAPLPEGVRPPDHPPGGWLIETESAPAASLELELTGMHADQMVWVGKLTEPQRRTLLLGKRYIVDLAKHDREVHHLADAVVQELTGETGIAQTRVLFSRKVGEGRELFLIDYDGRNLRQITRNGSLNLMPRWSPSADRICYTSYWQGRQRLLVLEGSSGESQKVADYSGLNFGAAWAPDGKELVVTLSRDGNPELYRMQPDGRITQRLSFEPSIECSPMFDPTGRQIVFTSDRTGVPQIYVMGREGATRRRLTWEGRYNESGVWSPRGDRIAYVSRRESRFQIFMIDPDGSNLRPVTVVADGNNEDPAWAPDGRHLVVSSDRAGGEALWILDVDSGAARPLTSGGVDDNGPHWSGPPNAAPAPSAAASSNRP